MNSKLQVRNKATSIPNMAVHDSNYYNNLSAILYLEADSNYTYIYTIRGRKRLVSKCLKHLITSMESIPWIRCHAKYAVNRNYLSLLVLIGTQPYCLINNSCKIPISRRKKNEVKRNFSYGDNEVI